MCSNLLGSREIITDVLHCERTIIVAGNNANRGHVNCFLSPSFLPCQGRGMIPCVTMGGARIERSNRGHVNYFLSPSFLPCQGRGMIPCVTMGGARIGRSNRGHVNYFLSPSFLPCQGRGMIPCVTMGGARIERSSIHSEIFGSVNTYFRCLLYHGSP